MRTPWLWIAAALLFGGIIHIATILAMPHLADRDAWSRLEELSSSNQMYLLPPGAEDPPLPLMAPDIAYAFCRFDLRDKNVLVELTMGSATWTVAMYGRQGENFYLISGAEAKRHALRLLVVPRAKLAEEASSEQSEEGDEQIIVISPAMEGIILIRAPLRGQSFTARTINSLQEARCGTVTEPDPDLLVSESEEDGPGLPVPGDRARRSGVAFP